MFNRIITIVCIGILLFVLAFVAETSNISPLIVNNNEKNIVYDFTASWCKPCIKMKMQVWPHKNIKNLLKHYHSNNKIEIDVDDERNFDLVDKFNVKSIPTIIITDKNSNELSRVIGYQNVDNLSKFLNMWKEPQLAPEKSTIGLKERVLYYSN